MNPNKHLKPAFSLVATAFCLFAATLPAFAHPPVDDTRRIAVVSAFPPEIALLKSDLQDEETHRINGVAFTTGALDGREVVLFLSGISVVNAAMTVQVALDHFRIDRIVFSGIAGGVDPGLNIGDVAITEQWGQYLELVLARQGGDGGEGNDRWSKPPFFEYPFAGFGMMFPRSVDVLREGAEAPETRFWFPADPDMLALARTVAAGMALERCTAESVCLGRVPKVVVGGNGVSGSAFVDNAAFREYTFETFGARVLDMESAAVAHVAWSNRVPFIAVRSVSDLAGGGDHSNELPVFFQLAAGNAAAVVRALLRALPE